MIDERTRGILEGLVGSLTRCRETLLMYAPHLPANTPVLRGSAFWIEETQRLLAQAIEAGTDETRNAAQPEGRERGPKGAPND